MLSPLRSPQGAHFLVDRPQHTVDVLQHVVVPEADHAVGFGSHHVSFGYDYTGRRVWEKDNGSLSLYYNPYVEVTDGVMLKWYHIGGVRVASAHRPAPSGTAALAGPQAVEFAADSRGGAVLIAAVLRPDTAAAAAVLFGLCAMSLLLPGRRKAVVGLRLRHGQVLLVIVAFAATSSPVPFMVRPAAGGGGGSCPVGTIKHYHTDHLGSVQAITDSAGNLSEQIRYRAYGEVRGRWNGSSPPQALPNIDPSIRKEFTGYHTETTSGLQYAGARFYDPALGMFLTHDPARQFANPYAYGPWNPLSGTDPTGTVFLIDDALAWLVFGLVVASFVNTVVQSVQAGNAPEAAIFDGITAGVASAGTAGALGIVRGGIEALNYSGTLLAFDLATVGGGAYSAVRGFESGDYVLGSVGAVATALGVVNILETAAAGGYRTKSGRRTQFAADTGSLSDASNDIRGEYVLDEVIVEATRLQGVRSPLLDPVNLAAGMLVGALVAGMIRGGGSKWNNSPGAGGAEHRHARGRADGTTRDHRVDGEDGAEQRNALF